MSPAESALLAAALGRRDRVRDPRGGRGLRQPRPVAAVGPGRGDRGRGGRQPEHDRRAGDRQPGRDALARRRAGRSSRPGIPARPAARRSPRCSPARSTRRAACRSRFPADLAQTPRPELPGLGTPWGTPITIDYDEGAEVGYRWFAKTGRDAALRVRPRPQLHDLRLRRPRRSRAARPSRDLHRHQHRRARGRRRATALPDRAAGRLRLLGFERVELAPGESRDGHDHRRAARARAVRRRADRSLDRGRRAGADRAPLSGRATTTTSQAPAR